MAATLTAPPAFDPSQWPDSPREPDGYSGCRFDFVAELIKPGDDSHMLVMGTAIPAFSIQLHRPANDPNYPIYFEIPGRAYHYVVSVWLDRVEIEVHGNTWHGLQSIMWPTTRDQLVRALQTIVDDSM
jgi:hypothetical protein